MAHDLETNASLKQRVDDYLRQYSTKNNSFILAAQAEAELDEYMLKRAEKELREAQARLDTLQRQIETRRQRN